MARVTGLSDLRSKLWQIDNRVRDAAEQALEDGAEETAKMMRGLVPVDQGDLKRSIRIVKGRNKRGPFIRIIGGDDKAYYARWVEFGTAANPARPFFFPAWRANRRRVRSRITRQTRKAIRQAIR